MISNASVSRWRFILWIWAGTFLGLALHTAYGDALDNWTMRTFPTVSLPFCSPPNGATNATPLLWKVMFHQGAFVAAGTGPCSQDTPTVVLRSTDGVNWSRSTINGYNGFFGATVSPNAIVGVGFWGETQVSTDGVQWSRNYYQPVVNLNAVAYGAGRYVAVGDNFAGSARGVIATSTDGFNWNAGTFFLNQTASNEFVTVSFGNGVFWAATPTLLYRSTDGTSFTKSGSSAGERIICFGNDRFIRVGNMLMVSTDGTAWQPAAQPTAAPVDRITFGAGMFVATAGRDVASSMDGFNWTVRLNALPMAARDLTFGNGMFIALTSTNYFSGSQYSVSDPVAHVHQATGPNTLWLRGIKNRQYDILATNNLTASNWPVVTRITLTTSPQAWTDTNAVTSGQRFYRSSLVP